MGLEFICPQVGQLVGRKSPASAHVAKGQGMLEVGKGHDDAGPLAYKFVFAQLVIYDVLGDLPFRQAVGVLLSIHVLPGTVRRGHQAPSRTDAHGRRHCVT